MTSASILGIIISKLYHKKRLYPVIQLKIDEDSKIGFYCIIQPFGLTVCLWVESNREFPLDA